MRGWAAVDRYQTPGGMPGFTVVRVVPSTGRPPPRLLASISAQLGRGDQASGAGDHVKWQPRSAYIEQAPFREVVVYDLDGGCSPSPH